MQKFPKIRYPNDPETDGVLDGDVVVTEKLDGANFRFTTENDGEDLYVGTRNHTYHEDNEDLPHAFKHAVEYIRSLDWDDLDSVVFYGEAMHRHTLDYEDIDWHTPEKGPDHVPLDSDIPNVVVFDAQDKESGEWVRWDVFHDAATWRGFQVVPILDYGDPEDVSFDIPEESVFGGPAEGIVVRRFDGSVRAKKVSEDFQEKKGGPSRGDSSPTEAQSDAAEFCAMYLTEARIEKHAHKLVDEGEYDHLQMPMMGVLPKRVLKDIMEEEGWDLLNGEFEAVWDEDFKSAVRKKASDKCARVLRSLCQEL